MIGIDTADACIYPYSISRSRLQAHEIAFKPDLGCANVVAAELNITTEI